MSTASDAVPNSVVDQAIDWSLKMTFNTPDAATRQAFERWLALSAAHRQAWQRLQSLNGPFAGLPSRAALDTLNKLPEGRLQRRQALKLLAVFAGVGALGWQGARFTPWQRLVADYSTPVGVHRRWTLADGSVLALDTDSAVRVDFTAPQRRVRLLRGQLALEVGAAGTAPSLPPLQLDTPHCQVQCQQAQVQARLEADATVLWVSAGEVQVRPTGTGPVFTVQANQRWRVEAHQATRLADGDPLQGAWRDGLLVARDLPLHAVLAELARYRVGHLGCDPRIAARPISGNFSTTRSDQALELIARAQGLHVQRLTRFWVRLVPA